MRLTRPEAFGRLLSQAEKREQGVQHDRRHRECGHAKWTEERLAEERTHALVPGVVLADLAAVLNYARELERALEIDDGE